MEFKGQDGVAGEQLRTTSCPARRDGGLEFLGETGLARRASSAEGSRWSAESAAAERCELRPEIGEVGCDQKNKSGEHCSSAEPFASGDDPFPSSPKRRFHHKERGDIRWVNTGEETSLTIVFFCFLVWFVSSCLETGLRSPVRCGGRGGALADRASVARASRAGLPVRCESMRMMLKNSHEWRWRALGDGRWARNRWVDPAG